MICTCLHRQRNHLARALTFPLSLHGWKMHSYYLASHNVSRTSECHFTLLPSIAEILIKPFYLRRKEPAEHHPPRLWKRFLLRRLRAPLLHLASHLLHARTIHRNTRDNRSVYHHDLNILMLFPSRAILWIPNAHPCIPRVLARTIDLTFDYIA